MALNDENGGGECGDEDWPIGMENQKAGDRKKAGGDDGAERKVAGPGDNADEDQDHGEQGQGSQNGKSPCECSYRLATLEVKPDRERVSGQNGQSRGAHPERTASGKRTGDPDGGGSFEAIQYERQDTGLRTRCAKHISRPDVSRAGGAYVRTRHELHDDQTEGNASDEVSQNDGKRSHHVRDTLVRETTAASSGHDASFV